MAAALLGPGTQMRVAAAPAAAAGWVDVQSERGGAYYTVRPGDTLTAIAAWYGVPLQALMEANHIRNPNKIYVGQELYIPAGGAGGPACVEYYRIDRGDTLSEIAWAYGLDVWELAEANGIYDLNEIFYGQRLCIPSAGSYGSGGHGGYDDHKQSGGQGGYAGPEAYGPRPDSDDRDHDSDDHGYGNPENRPDQDGYGGQGGNDGPRPNHEGQQDGPRPEPNEYRPENNAPGYEDGPKPDEARHEPDQDGPKSPDRPEGRPDESGPYSDDHGPKPDGPDNHGDRPDGYGGGPDHPENRPDDHGPDDYGKRPDHGLKGPNEYWRGQYFADKYFTEFVDERQDIEVRFNWYAESPFPGMPSDRFSVRWEKVEAFGAGNYEFVAVADDGVRVYVDDKLIIDGWKIQPATEYKAEIYLEEGLHKLAVDYYEEGNEAQIDVQWHGVKEREHRR
jgi:LysM repeat protein